jgi:copper chaperone CopZ
MTALFASAIASVSIAAEPVTRIDVKGMHCVMCAKKISTKLQAIPGVASAVADFKSGSVMVTTKPTVALSPRYLWETVESTGYRPVRLSGPAGTFDAKPKK